MSITTFDTLLGMPGGIKLPCRSVAVKEKDKLILISPIKFTDSQVDQIRKLGDVTDLVAPSLYHHLYMPRAVQLFPKAKVWGVPEFRKKRSDIAWTHDLSEQSWPYREFLDVLSLEGAPAFSEMEFLHKPTRTLIATDLCFNMCKPVGWASPLILGLFGTYDGFAMSRLMKIRVKNRTEFEGSLELILAWDFDRIIMGHGDPIEGDAKSKLKEAFCSRGFLVK